MGIVILAAVVALAAIGIAAGSRRKGSGLFQETAPMFAYPSFVRGRKVTNARADSDGWVRKPQAELAREAGEAMGLPGPLDLSTYTLARFLGSEWASARSREKASIAWCIVNRLRLRRRAYPNAGWTMLRMATKTTRHGDRGLFGSQEHGRYASTSRDPTDKDVYVASMVLSGAWPDLTGGANQFFDPATQRAMHRRKPHLYKTPEELIASWTASGRQEVYPTPSGVRANELVMLGPRRA